MQSIHTCLYQSNQSKFENKLRSQRCKMRFFESFFIHYKGIHLGDTVRKLYLLQHCYFFANWCCQGHFREHFRTFFWWVDISIRKEPRARQKCKGENTTWNGSISRAKKMLCKVVLSRLSWLVLLVYHLAASAETYFCCKENSKRHLALLDNGEKRAINSDTLTKKRKLEIYVLFVVTRAILPGIYYCVQKTFF